MAEVIYPTWRFHATKQACIVLNPEQDAALGDGWHDSPAKCSEPEPEPAEPEGVPDFFPDLPKEQPYPVCVPLAVPEPEILTVPGTEELPWEPPKEEKTEKEPEPECEESDAEPEPEAGPETEGEPEKQRRGRRK